MPVGSLRRQIGPLICISNSIPLNLWRASYQYDFMIGTHGRKSKHNYSYYWHRNIFITTSGQFNTEGLKYVVKEMGVDRCLFSIGMDTSSPRPVGDVLELIFERPPLQRRLGRADLVEDGGSAGEGQRGDREGKRDSLTQTATGAVRSILVTCLP